MSEQENMSRFRKFICNKLGWHVAGHQIWTDGFQSSSYCHHCKRRVLLDSQGNWFAANNLLEHTDKD